MPTAFIAEYGTGGPVIGILAEFDALPGLSNAAVPYPQPLPEGDGNGHGCGHNLIGSGAVGAAVAIRSWLETAQVAGTVRLYGCPAEENWNGKILMARTGCFDDLDAALHWHPLDRTMTANIRTTAVASLQVEFLGRSAHAGVSPWLGRSALHAMELFAHGINLMREHIQPTARIHYIFLEAGVAANVIPDHTLVDIRFRDNSPEQVAAGVAWFEDVAAGAARATQTTAKVTFLTGCHNILPNTPMAQRTQAILQALGAPDYSEEEEAFARAVQQATGLPEKGMFRHVVPLQNEPSLGGSSDVGDVSKLVPTMGFSMPTMPDGISLHSWGATAAHGMSIGHKGALHAAKALAALAAELFSDGELLAAAKADWTKRMDGSRYQSLLPADASGLPSSLLQHGSTKRAEDELVAGVVA
jgi:aminobenzoyl-glutamate utilization protein B